MTKKREMTTPERHQYAIARRTLALSDTGALILGGMTKAEAREIITRLKAQGKV